MNWKFLEGKMGWLWIEVCRGIFEVFTTKISTKFMFLWAIWVCGKAFNIKFQEKLKFRLKILWKLQNSPELRYQNQFFKNTHENTLKCMRSLDQDFCTWEIRKKQKKSNFVTHQSQYLNLVQKRYCFKRN